MYSMCIVGKNSENISKEVCKKLGYKYNCCTASTIKNRNRIVYSMPLLESISLDVFVVYLYDNESGNICNKHRIDNKVLCINIDDSKSNNIENMIISRYLDWCLGDKICI